MFHIVLFLVSYISRLKVRGERREAGNFIALPTHPRGSYLPSVERLFRGDPDNRTEVLTQNYNDMKKLTFLICLMFLAFGTTNAWAETETVIQGNYRVTTG